MSKLRIKATEIRNQAKALYEEYKDSESGMPEEVRKQFDGFMEESDALIRRADESDAIEKRLNDQAARFLADKAERGGGYADGGANGPHNDLKNTRGGKHSYSILKALRQDVNQRLGRRDDSLDGLELEAHQDLQQKRRAAGFKEARGVLVPLDLSPYAGEQRALDTTAGTGGIVTKLSTDLISILRNRMVTASLGATVLSDMLGPFAIPRQNAAATGYWVAEGSAPTASNQTLDQVTFSPKTVGAYTDYTRRFMEQTSIPAENLVRNDLMAVIARAVETAALNGSGSSNQPTGIGQNSNVTTVSIGTNGGVPTLATLVGMESALATANADLGSLGYIVNAKIRGYLKTAPKIGSTFPVFLWDSLAGTTPVNGYRAEVTNILPSNLTKGTSTGICNMMLFGNWNDLVIALWSGVDLLTDPYTGSSTGNVRVVAMQDCDINVRHPESFSKVVDATTS